VAAAVKLDRKATIALVGLLLVIVVIVGLTIRSSVIALTPDATIAAPSPENQDEMIQVAGHTVLLKHGSAANRIAHWLHPGSGDAEAFELGDKSFVAGSDTLTPEGERRAEVFAQMMAHVAALDAEIFLSDQRTEVDLEKARAGRLRDDLISKGVQPARITLPDKPIDGGAALSRKPELIVLLSD